MTSIRCAVLCSAAGLALASLAGCKKEAVVAQNESAESVANKVAAANVKPRAGRWEASMRLDKMEMPGMPPEAKAAMDKQANVTQTYATCLTPEEAEKPSTGFFQKGAQGCKYNHFVMADGRIDAETTCRPQGQEIVTKMTGTYSESSYDIHVETRAEMQKGMPMLMNASISARRVGECNGSEM